jgi:hypothetical protein
MIDDDDNPESAAILLERARGRSYGEIARSHSKTIAEVRRVLEAEAARLYDGKETRQAILVEATQVRVLKQKHFELALASDDVVHAEMVRKLGDRLASLLGLGAPASYAVTLAHSVAPAAPRGDVELISAAIDRLRAEAPKAPLTPDAG